MSIAVQAGDSTWADTIPQLEPPLLQPLRDVLGAGPALLSPGSADGSLGTCGSTRWLHPDGSSKWQWLNSGQKNHVAENARSIFLQSNSVAQGQVPAPQGDSRSQTLPSATCQPRVGQASL